MSDIFMPFGKYEGERYFLSADACSGILHRAERRGKKLPTLLAAVIKRVAGVTTSTGAAP